MSAPLSAAEAKEAWATAYKAWAWAERYALRSVEELFHMLETCRRAWVVYEEALSRSAGGAP